MDKKDIYEHLAKIYLDASSEKSKKVSKYPPAEINNWIFAALAVLFVLSVILVIPFTKNLGDFFSKRKNLKSEVALVIQPETVKINFNFDPAKKETYSVDLKGLNMVKFRALGFSVRKASYKENLALRIEFTTSFKEHAEVYVTNISPKWQNYVIQLSDFKKITMWSKMSNLDFSVEAWNTKAKKDLVYIDNVRFLR